MKTIIFSTLLFTLTFQTAQASALHFTENKLAVCNIETSGGDPIDIKVVVAQKRIWLVADEMPMKCLKTQIKNVKGEVVLEKCFSSKCADWFLNIESLPKGEYTLHLGASRVEKFKK